MIERVEFLPAQICFPVNGFILCNWVHHPQKDGYGILGHKWIKIERKQKTKSLALTKDLEIDE